ncbi:MAG: peptidase [Nitrosopumilus sp.]|uniref:peptidase n=1 Tax=Nitrosopumilus sp. TaxID=2024843 RepID=UPI00246BC243|nr:peptidase [Nitrosopumilus sp.]MDH5430879.1 peptidase [Nitrosopumilus sp.]MDH5665140.1 peptidase [Nitrosopumilus sp.]MDH5697164.1 peptidase [Nitrosopumilus sp.]
MEKKYAKKIQTSGHSLKSFFLFAILIFFSMFVFDSAFGHGVGSETFPPVDLNGKQVTLEISSSKNDPEKNDDQQISISMIDFDSKITLRDVTFLIKSYRGETFLFEQEFKADNGFVVFNFISEDSDTVVIEEVADNGLFGSLLGLESRMINVKGPKLSEGGLYKFDISILTADGYSQKLAEPLIFNAGISIAQTTTHNFVDPNFGEQNIDIVTYYDEISDFNYDSHSKEISYSMPFEWSESNINQTSVVHEELVIPKTFGDLLVSGFSMYVNGIKLSDDVTTIDDFFSDGRVVHFIIYQKELLNIFQNGSDQNQMNFVIKPDRDYVHLSSVTENGQFRILATTEPENLTSNSNAKIIFDVTDIFLKNKPVSTTYDFSVTQNEKIIFEQSGISTDSKDKHNIAEFMVPENISGIVNLNFYNLDNNDLAKTSIPIVINRVTNQNEILIPDWIRNNALWWSEEQIDDNTFIQGIEYLIKNNIIVIPQTQQETTDAQKIPSWIRNNAEWWAAGQIDDETFVQGLEFLIKKGIIHV